MRNYRNIKFIKCIITTIFLVLNFNLRSISAESNSLKKDEVTIGRHGGRLLGNKDFQAEVTIYEQNVDPQSRIYFYTNTKIIDPKEVELKIEFHRLDRVDTFSYIKQNNYLIGDKIVEEPHSFDIKIYAKYNGKTYFWEYSSYEGRTTLSKDAIKSSGIKTEFAGPRKLLITTKLNGKIVPNEYRSMHVTPRFSGMVKELKKELGDNVSKGEVIAVMESNESLREYKVKSKIDGTVIVRDASPGEVLSQGDSIYVVSDLSTVWANFQAYSKDLPKLKKGQKVLLYQNNFSKPISEAQISYIAPVGNENTQMFLVRAVIINKNLELKPGLFISGKVILEEKKVPLAVKASAIQSFRDWDVVFIQHENNFEIAIVELGQRDGEWVEVLSGLKSNTPYVTKNSFILKADILKSGAVHHHH